MCSMLLAMSLEGHALFADRIRDVVDHLHDALGSVADLGYRRAGLPASSTPLPACLTPVSHAADGAARTALDFFDHSGDFARRQAGALGQLRTSSATTAKPRALLSGARGFDGGVEREQIGLIGYFADCLDDGGDLVGLTAEVFDDCRRGLYASDILFISAAALWMTTAPMPDKSPACTEMP